VHEQLHPLDIRIEDDAIVTESDSGFIACGVSVAVDEIEALMRQ
jgi:hypothetical protein